MGPKKNTASQIPLLSGTAANATPDSNAFTLAATMSTL
jgi:hypothetical protein